MATTYNFIADNKRRTWIIVLLFPLSFAVLTYVCLFLINWLVVEVDGPTSSGQAIWSEVWESSNMVAAYFIPIVMGIALIWIVISYFAGDKMLLRNAEAMEISREDSPKLFRIVENLCITRGMPLPKIYVINDRALNAFATGRNPQNSSIAVTAGLMAAMDKQELEAVIAHELGHVENRDITLMLVCIAGITFFTLVGELLVRSAARVSSRSKKEAGMVAVIIVLVGVLFLIFGYFVAPLLRLAMSREREYLADATAALTTRNPGALASALEKISSNPAMHALDEHPSMAAMCIDSPRKIEAKLFNRLAGLYATHPPIEERISRLRAMDGVKLF